MIRRCRGGGVSCRVVIAVVAALAPLIAGCEAGTAAPVLQWHPPTDGAGLTARYITLSNVFVLGAPLGSALQPGQNAGVFFALTNTGSKGYRDRLISIMAPGTARSVRLPGGQVWVNAQHSVLLTGPRPAVIMEDLLRPVTGGSVLTLQFLFAKAGLQTLRVPVMPMTQFYSTYSPAPTPTLTPAASPQPSPSGSPSPTRKHHRSHRSPSP